MIKKVLFFTAATLALTACTQTDLIEENQESGAIIGFNSHVKNSTRAVTNANFSKFFVFGGYTLPEQADYHTLFNDVEVSKDGDNWTYSGSSKYWIKDASYKFYGYSCDNLALNYGTATFSTEGADAGTFKITEFVCNDTHQHDLVFAESQAVGKETGNEKVAMSFKHLLAKVNAKFKSGFDPDFTITISDVELRNVYDKADFSSKTGGWSNQLRTVEYNDGASQWTKVTLRLEGSDNTIYAAKPGSEGVEAVPAKDLVTSAGFVLPVTYSTNNLTLSFKIVVKQGDDTIYSDYVRGNIQPSWVTGNAYTYNVTVNGSAAGIEKIEFSVDATDGVQDWTENPDTDFNVGT